MKNINCINEEEYLEKMNDTVIDGKTTKDYRITINNFLSKILLPTSKYVDFYKNYSISQSKFIKNNNFHRVYDHMHQFRLLTPIKFPVNSVHCMFSCPYNTVTDLKDDVNEPWICSNYKIYLLNPKHYKYYLPNTVSLLHVEDLDKKYMDGITDAVVASINLQMIYETGEPFVYFIS